MIADDQTLVRESFALLLDLEGVIEVVGQAGDGLEAVAIARSLRPDVVVMDIRMPNLDGLEATRRLMADPTPPRVLILTTFDSDENLYEAMKAGASGFLLKDVRRGQLAEAVRTVMAGEALVSPQITRRLIETFCHRRPVGCGVPEALSALTPRELEILRLVARGLTNNEIAATLFVGQTTVKTHVAHILTKLALKDRAQAVVVAYECGIAVPGESRIHRA
ncbi:MAG TPA: response regulator transcription factor [Acidimicrobiales bacterium]|nr:response regulator transcription factor [Acidimicrobiales bacterium]